MLGDFPDTLKFYDLQRTGSGDEKAVLSATVAADVEEMLGLSQTNYSDETIGTLNASIPATNSYYLANTETLQGKLVKYGTQWFRVTEVRPISSAVTNTVEFVDLVLEKAEAPDGGNLS